MKKKILNVKFKKDFAVKMHANVFFKFWRTK